VSAAGTGEGDGGARALGAPQGGDARPADITWLHAEVAGGFLPRDPVEDLDVAPGTDGAAGDDLGLAVAVEVGGADAEAAGEAGIGKLAEERGCGGGVGRL